MKKTKVIIIIAVVVLLLILAFITTSILFRNSYNSSGKFDSVTRNTNLQVSNLAMPAPASLPQEKIASDGVAMDAGSTDSSSAEHNVSDKKIIKNGDLNVQVNDADASSKEISQIAKDNGGEVFSSNFYKNANNAQSGTITVKVPVQNFEKTFEALKKVSSLVNSQSTSGNDVTEQYTDLQSRLRNKQAEEQAFVKILDKADKITDIISVTRELSRVRGEIEVLQGRIKYIDSQSDMSTITIFLTEDRNITVSDSWRPFQLMKNTINSLLKDVQGFINFLIVLIIRVIPVFLAYILIFYILYKIGRKIYLKIKLSRKELGN